MKTALYALLAIAAFAAPSAANAADAPAANKPHATINVRIDPALSKKEEEYKKAFAALTKEQQAMLEALDKKNTELNAPNFEIIGQRAKFNACAKSNPALAQKYSAALLNFKYRKLDEYADLRTKFFTEMAKINFIDKNLLDSHLTMQANVQAQMISGMGNLLQNIKPEECAKVAAELDNYTAPYFEEANGSVFKSGDTRDSLTKKVKTCSLTLAHNQKDGVQQSLAILVIPDSPETGTFEFSAKTFLSPENVAPVESLWMDFGTLNTRFMARTTKPGEEMEIGVMPVEAIVPALREMAKVPTIVSIKNTGKAKANVFRTQVPSKFELDKFSKCVGAAQPKLLGQLVKAGFDAQGGPDSIPVQAAVVDPNYNASQSSPSRNNPGTCMLNIGPYVEKPDVNIGASLMIGVKKMNNGTVAIMNGFWVLGEKGGTRLTISKASLETKYPNGENLSTDDFSPHLVPGQRYEIYFSAEENNDVMNGIIKNGIKLNAETKELTKPLSHSFPPPIPETLQAFNGCLDRLQKSMTAHAVKTKRK